VSTTHTFSDKPNRSARFRMISLFMTLFATYISLNAQQTELVSISSWKDAVLTQSIAIENKSFHVYSNGSLIMLNPSNGLTIDVHLPDSMLAAEIHEYHGAAWVRMISGDLYRTQDFITWTRELAGVELVYVDEHDELFVLDSFGVSRAARIGATTILEPLRAVDRSVDVVAFFVRNDTVVVSLSQGEGSLVYTRNGTYPLRHIEFTSALAVSPGLTTVTNGMSIWLLHGIAERDSQSVRKYELVFHYATTSSSIRNNERFVSFAGVTSSVPRLPVFGTVTNVGAELFKSSDLPSRIALSMTLIGDYSVFAFSNARFTVKRDTSYIDYGLQDSTVQQTLATIPFVTPRGLSTLSIVKPFDDQPGKKGYLLRYADGSTAQLTDMPPDPWHTFVSAIRTANGDEIIVSRPNIYHRRSGAASFNIASNAVNLAATTRALPVIIDDSTLLVHSNVNRYLLSFDNGASWCVRIIPGLRDIPNAILVSDSLIVIESSGEWAVCHRSDLTKETVPNAYFAQSENVPVRVACVTNTSVDVVCTKYVPGQSNTHRTFFLIHYENGRRDTISFKLPYALSQSALLQCRRNGDTLLVFTSNGRRNNAQLSVFVGSELIRHKFLSTLPFAPMNNLNTQSKRFVSNAELELARIDLGLKATIYFGDYETLSSINLHPIKSTSLSVYPNPARSYVTIDIEGHHNEPTRFEIWDSLGFVRKKHNVSTPAVLDVRDLESGTYRIVMHANRSVLSTSFMIVR
jgi:hypothetical protein